MKIISKKNHYRDMINKGELEIPDAMKKSLGIEICDALVGVVEAERAVMKVSGSAVIDNHEGREDLLLKRKKSLIETLRRSNFSSDNALDVYMYLLRATCIIVKSKIQFNMKDKIHALSKLKSNADLGITMLCTPHSLNKSLSGKYPGVPNGNSILIGEMEHEINRMKKKNTSYRRTTLSISFAANQEIFYELVESMIHDVVLFGRTIK